VEASPSLKAPRDAKIKSRAKGVIGLRRKSKPEKLRCRVKVELLIQKVEAERRGRECGCT
jgi:hypothetical protein